MSMYMILYLMLQLAMLDAKLMGEGVLPPISWPVVWIPTYLLILALLFFLRVNRRNQ